MERVRDISFRAHEALGCRGASRVDLIVDGSDLPCLLEVNTIPGMTETSLLPKIAALAGYDFSSLIEAIILDALNRRGEK
ncbi:D-alanine--D-alanine ligase [bacterium BMS3Bbin07]|nr:D-alanine--D-alanine ligase [bacterium BMS3Bbin07]